jgi:hypothetical protein
VRTHQWGGKWRAEHRGPVLGLTGARAMVWRPSDGNEVMTEEKLSGGSAQALVEGQKIGVGCGENRSRHLPLIGAVRR